MKKWCLVLASFLFPLSFASANIIISEIMYDLPGTDTDHEWVEIHNSGSSSVDITGWKFYDGSNHTLNAPPANGGQGSMVIPAGGYAILTGNATTFLSDHANFSGIVIDTVMSLANSSETLKIIKSDNSEADSYTYDSSQGASGDGNTLQLVNLSWVVGAESPGSVNTASSNSSAGAPGEGLYEGKTETNVITTESIPESKIQVKIITDVNAFTKAPVSFMAVAYDPSGQEIYTGRFFWNFGDGSSFDTTNRKTFTHTYFYEGEYLVSVEYYKDHFNTLPDAVTKVSVKVVPMTVVISRIGDENDFFIELSNNSKYDFDISRWILFYGTQTFSFPRNTIINAEDNLILPPAVLDFSYKEGETVMLATASGEIIFKYGKTEPKRNITTQTVSKPVVKAKPESNGAKDLTATVANSVEESTSWPFFALVGLIFSSALGVYFIRNPQKENEDFGLLDE